jgi:dienelactone hydrolase
MHAERDDPTTPQNPRNTKQEDNTMKTGNTQRTERIGKAEATLRVLPPYKLPSDQRLGRLNDLDGYFPFTPPSSRKEWEQRAEYVRRQMLVALGLWPMPTPTPLNPVIHGCRDHGDHTVEKVYFESLPGFFVTGSLYRPKGKPGRHPAVLCPHGHWPNGRFHDSGLEQVREQIVQGAERFENGGRNPLQARCVQLARMGCVVFLYDMIGYADNEQISFGLAHQFGRQRPEMNTVKQWGLFSPAAETYLQSVMGLQTYNSIRALDFVTGLPDVDAERIAVTGSSGGGTQTFILGALDPRVKVAIPVVMVSTAMQGGCTCENASLLRVGTGNVEFAALFAPRPLCMVSANDWTRDMPAKGFPQLQALYRLFGAEQNVQLHPLIHFEHNYNYVSRARMYEWVNQHFGLGLPTPVVEEDYPRLTTAEQTVWDDAHPKPPCGDEVERSVLRWWTEDADRQLTRVMPKDSATWQRFRKVVGGAIDVVIGGRLPAAGTVQFKQSSAGGNGAHRILSGILWNTAQGSGLPTVVLEPGAPGPRVAVWLSRDGKAGLFTARGEPRPAVARLLEAGVAVVGVDLIYQGEYLEDGKPLSQTRRVDNPREAAAFTFGYNRAVFALRAHDALTAIRFAKSFRKGASVSLVGLDGAGHWAAAALAQAEGAIAKAAIDSDGFRFGNILDLASPDFLPGGAKYFDLPGMLALGAPTPLWLAGEGTAAPDVVTAAYRVAGNRKNLTLATGKAAQRVDQAVQWLLR